MRFVCYFCILLVDAGFPPSCSSTVLGGITYVLFQVPVKFMCGVKCMDSQ